VLSSGRRGGVLGYGVPVPFPAFLLIASLIVRALIDAGAMSLGLRHNMPDIPRRERARSKLLERR